MICPACEGEAVVMVAVPGGYFDQNLGNYLPDERAEQCEACNGTGEVEGGEDE